MMIKINSIHFKTDKKLDDFIESKVEKLFGLFDGISTGEITLRVENVDDEKNKVAEIKLDVAGGDLFAKKQCKTFEEATDSAVDALKKQLIKHKEKLRRN